MIYYSVYIYTYIRISTYDQTRHQKIYDATDNSETQYHLPNWPMFFCKSHACFSSLSPVSAPSFDESSGGKVPHPNNPPWIPKIAEKNWWIQRCWIVFMKNLFTNQTYYVYVVFSKNTFSSYDLGKLFWDTHPKSHIDRMIQRSRNVWAYQHFWSPALAHFLLDPSRTLKVQQVIYWIWKWRVEYYSKLDISSYPFLLISNELWPTAQVLLFLQDGLNLLQVSLAWYRWSLWDADSWPRVVQKNHVFTMESKVRSAEVTYPPEV